MYAAEHLLNMSPFTGIIPTPHSPRKEACGATEEEMEGRNATNLGISESLKLVSHTRLSAHRDCHLPLMTLMHLCKAGGGSRL